MENDFVYWRHATPVGIKIEEISGGEGKSGELWNEMARQIYSENGKDGYRQMGHFASGAPFLADSEERVSVSHTPGMFVVATLPPREDAVLSEFSEEAALGVDVEREDRKKAMDLRERFLNEEELKLVDPESVKENILAWTAKEALYKAALTPGLDFRKNLILKKLPECLEIGPWLEANFKDKASASIPMLGEATILLPNGASIPMLLYSYLSDGYIITLAFSPSTRRFTK